MNEGDLFSALMALEEAIEEYTVDDADIDARFERLVDDAQCLADEYVPTVLMAWAEHREGAAARAILERALAAPNPPTGARQGIRLAIAKTYPVGDAQRQQLEALLADTGELVDPLGVRMALVDCLSALEDWPAAVAHINWICSLDSSGPWEAMRRAELLTLSGEVDEAAAAWRGAWASAMTAAVDAADPDDVWDAAEALAAMLDDRNPLIIEQANQLHARLRAAVEAAQTERAEALAWVIADTDDAVVAARAAARLAGTAEDAARCRTIRQTIRTARQAWIHAEDDAAQGALLAPVEAALAKARALDAHLLILDCLEVLSLGAEGAARRALASEALVAADASGRHDLLGRALDGYASAARAVGEVADAATAEARALEEFAAHGRLSTLIARSLGIARRRLRAGDAEGARRLVVAAEGELDVFAEFSEMAHEKASLDDLEAAVERLRTRLG